MPRLSLNLLAAAMLVAAAASADVLVTRDGSAIETRGPWKVKGRQVLFTNDQGVLSSLRLDDVDLEASEAATREALEPPAPPPVEEEEAPPAEPREAPAEAAIEINNANLHRVARTSGRDEAAVASQLSGAELRDLGEEMGRTMADLSRGMVEGMAEGMAEMTGAATGGAGGDFEEGMEKMGEQMAEGMAKGMEAMGEVMGVMAAMAPRVAALEQQFDLETPEGIRAAAPGLADLAGFLRDQTSQVGPEAAEMLNGIASQMEEVAELARTDPEEALKRRREMEASQ